MITFFFKFLHNFPVQLHVITSPLAGALSYTVHCYEALPLTTVSHGGTVTNTVCVAVTLTIRAVLSAPSIQAATFPLLVAGVVAEGVIAGPTVGGAGLAVVVLITHHVVRVAQLTLVTKVDVLGPLLSYSEVTACGQATDEVVLVFWKGSGCLVFIVLHTHTFIYIFKLYFVVLKLFLMLH